MSMEGCRASQQLLKERLDYSYSGRRELQFTSSTSLMGYEGRGCSDAKFLRQCFRILIKMHSTLTYILLLGGALQPGVLIQHHMQFSYCSPCRPAAVCLEFFAAITQALWRRNSIPGRLQ
jgi:hypothetical protein